jgi:predicted exporter
VRYLMVLHARAAEGVLEAAERLEGTIGQLTDGGAIGGAELVSRYLPSRKAQLARQAALPAPADLAERLAKAETGLPFREEAFQPFIEAVDRARAMPPITRGDVDSPAMSARIDTLLFTRDGEWFGLVALVDVRDPIAVAKAVEALADPEMTYIDTKGETDQLVAGYTSKTLRAIGAGALAVLFVLSAALRRPVLLARVALPIAGAAIVTLAALAALQIPLTIFHLVSLLLMAGVSIDYALFLNRMAAQEAAADLTLGTVLTCNVTTLLTFGLLAFCRTPILQSIGITVALGVFCGMVFAYVFSARSARAD